MKKRNSKILAFCAFLLAICSACKKNMQEQPTPVPQIADTLSVEGKKYTTIAISKQLWTSANYAGPGGISYNTANDKPMYGKYYTFEEVKAVRLPSGWRIPTMQDYITLAENQGVVFSQNRATAQESIKNLVSVDNWQKVPGTNTSGFNAQPGGYSYQNSEPKGGDIAEFWTVEGNTISIQENASGKSHNLSFYNNSNSPDYRFNLRFVRDR